MVCKQTNQPPSKRTKLKNIALIKEEKNLALCTVSLDKLIRLSTQPRHYLNPKAMQSLVELVKHNSILQSLLVRQPGDKYVVVAGEQTYRAAQKYDLQEVAVTIQKISDELGLHHAIV